MPKIFTPSRFRVLSGLFTNLSAGWIGAVLIFQNFSDLSISKARIILTLDIFAAILCLLLAFWLEEKGKK